MPMTTTCSLGAILSAEATSLAASMSKSPRSLPGGSPGAIGWWANFWHRRRRHCTAQVIPVHEFYSVTRLKRAQIRMTLQTKGERDSNEQAHNRLDGRDTARV